MSLISKPNRAYAVGETKSQNAVIKVYSVADLKRALTQVYQLPNGVGTIEIATDITITEPIKLRQFANEEAQPREIIIQGVSGTRIINGNKTNGTSYNYNQAGNGNIPVFDLGLGVNATAISDISKCKYVIRDLVINTPNSKPFGAIVSANINGDQRWLGPIAIQNIKAYNLWNVYAAYDTNPAPFSTTDRIILVNTKLDDFKFANIDSSITEFSLNSEYTGSFGGLFANIGPLDPVLAYVTSPSINYLHIWNNSSFAQNTFTSIFSIVKIDVGPLGTNYGSNNTIIGATLRPDSYGEGFTHITSGRESVSSTSAIFDTSSTRSAHNIIAEALIENSSSVVIEATQVTKTTYNVHTNGNTGMFIQDLQPNSHYEIDWVLAVKYDASGLTNNYHIKSTCRVDGLGSITLTNNSTIYAFEEVFTLINITPVSVGTAIVMSPTDPTPLEIDCSCNITITGLRMPIDY
jgi:hypothetical protein